MKEKKYNTIYKTEHGNYIARQIQNEDAYGGFNIMNESDLYNIVDQFQTHIMDFLPKRNDLIHIMSRWLQELENNYNIELP
jgi:hypothetical protein